MIQIAAFSEGNWRKKTKRISHCINKYHQQAKVGMSCLVAAGQSWNVMPGGSKSQSLQDLQVN